MFMFVEFTSLHVCSAHVQSRLDLDSDDAPLVDLFARAKILNDKHGAKIEGVPAS